MAYYFKDVSTTADQSTQDITEYLRREGWVVKNVEQEKYFQTLDVDLIILKKLPPNQSPSAYMIEIKGDTYYNTNNYFVETISNMTTKTLGCFLITKSDYIFYYFPKEKELHIIPTKEAQQYVLAHQHEFKKRNPSTTDSKGKHWYYSEGLLIPRKTMQKQVDIKVIKL